MAMTTMPLIDVLAQYADGDERGWHAEFAWLRMHHGDELNVLAADIATNGIREPILLGKDGRVWDGHHRLCVAHDLRTTNVPVEHA